MSEAHIPETADARTSAGFCLWRIYSWGEVEDELTEMSGTHLPPYEAAWGAPLPQEAEPESPEPQIQMLPEWEQPYQQQAIFHQYLFEWEPAYAGQGTLEAYHGQCMPEPACFQQENAPPLASPAGYRVLDTPSGGPLFTYYFWLGGPIDPYNIPGCSEYLPVTVSGDMRLTDVFNTYFLNVDAGALYQQLQNLEFYNIMQVMFRDGKPQQGTQNYYQGAKWTGITVRETQWHGWQKFWLVGSDREQAFLEACERAKELS